MQGCSAALSLQLRVSSRRDVSQPRQLCAIRVLVSVGVACALNSHAAKLMLCALKRGRRQARLLPKLLKHAGMKESASLLTVSLLMHAGSSSNGSPTREPAAAPAAEGPTSSSALGNDRMAWELLYDLRWRLPTEELDLAWSDALGTTSVMQVGGLISFLLQRFVCVSFAAEAARSGAAQCINCACTGSLRGTYHLYMS